jgi:hypothetical protein
MAPGPGDASASRRGFLAHGFGGLTALALGRGVHAGPSRGDRAAEAGPALRIDLRHRVLNGQDLELARYLEVEAAPEHPEHAALIRAGAGLAEALAWALAPSAASETWRLDELASRGGLDLSRADDPAIHRDREEANRRFCEALCIVLPRTEFFRLYLDRLRARAHAILGPSVAARLARMARAEVLGADDAEFLMSPEGPERALLAVRPLEAFRRYTYSRYLAVHDLLHAGAAEGAGPDLVVPSMAPPRARPGAPATPLRDQVLVLARIVQLCSGRVHPLVQFDPEASDAVAVVQDAIDRRGFVGVTLPGDRPSRHGRSLHALLTWCERRDVPIVVPGAGRPWGVARDDAPPWLSNGVDAAAVLGLHRGRRARERLERFYARQRMAPPRWMRTLDALPFPRNA